MRFEVAPQGSDSLYCRSIGAYRTKLELGQAACVLNFTRTTTFQVPGDNTVISLGVKPIAIQSTSGR